MAVAKPLNLPDPIAFSDLRDLEGKERRRLVGRKLQLDALGPNGKRPRTNEEDEELKEIVQKLASDDVVDPLFVAARGSIARDVKDHKQGLLPSQQLQQALHQLPDRPRESDWAKIILMAGLGKNPPLADAMTGLDAGDQQAALLGRLAKDFDAAIARIGNQGVQQADLDALAAQIVTDASPADEFGKVLADVVAAGKLSEAERLVDYLLVYYAQGASRRVGRANLTANEKKLAAVYGLLEADFVEAPADHSRITVYAYDPDEEGRRQKFGKAVFGAQGEYQTNQPLFEAILPILIKLGGQGAIDTVSALEWAQCVRILRDRGVTAAEPQLERKVDEALNVIQKVGEDVAPSLIGIDLPDLDAQDDFQIQADNIIALQPAYFAAMLEELKAFAVVDKLVELFQNGVLPVGRGEAGNGLFKYWKDTATRVSEAERRSFYARTLGVAGGDDGGMPNREFNDLFLRFVSSVSSFIRQNNVDDLLRTKLPGSISQQQVRKSARDLASNLSLHGYGMAYFMATELQKQVKDVIKLLNDKDIRNAYGARDMWQVIDQVATLELGGAKNSVRYRTMATSGAIIMAWLAQNAAKLSNSSFGPLLNVDDIRNPPPRPNGEKATTSPTDFDLVNACEQWLAVTGTQEDTVEDYSQHKESPTMPSRPIQIPSIAREMLEGAGVPAMSLGYTNGYPRH
jgi:hypothetical protein